MDVKFLEVYLNVVEMGSIAATARHLNLAPTTIAQQIKALESDLGVRLLTRSGPTLKPTVAGLRIVDRSREIVRSTHDLRAQASNTSLPAGPLRLGATPTALMGPLPRALRQWKKLYRDIQIHIEPGTSMTLFSKVTSGELDAALMVHPTFPLPKTCEWTELRKERLILLTPARMKVRDPLLTITQEPFIRYDRGVVAGKLADDYLIRHNLRTKVQFELELDGIEHIAKFVAEGLGVSILPDWPTISADRSVKRWVLPPPCPYRVVGLLWLRSSVRAPLAQVFAAILQAGALKDKLKKAKPSTPDGPR